MKIHTVVLLSGLVAFGAGCLKKDDNKGGGGTTPSTLSPAYNGTWLGSCNDKGGGVWEIDTMVIGGQGATLTYTEQDYSDSGCASTSGGPRAMTGSLVSVGDSVEVAGAIKVVFSIDGSGTANSLLKLENNDNTLRMGNPDNCTNQDCSGSEFPNSLSSTDIFTRQ